MLPLGGSHLIKIRANQSWLLWIIYTNLYTSSSQPSTIIIWLKTKLPKKQFTYLGNNLFKCRKYISIFTYSYAAVLGLVQWSKPYSHPLHARPQFNTQVLQYVRKRAFHSSKINVNIFEQFKFKFFSYFFYYSACAKMKTNASKTPPALW